MVFLVSQFAYGGGPKYVAGTTYFNPGTSGTPLTWLQGSINYYTDQGILSSILSGPNADAFVADAFSQWTSIPTVAISAARAGQLAEDVSGVNVTVNSNGTINLPADILPTAIGTPIGIVYDADGTVTDALLGQGAGSSSSCFNNAVTGGIDNFSTDAHFLHALIILNGNCAQTSTQLPDMEYRLVRVIGRVLGLDWSQLNLNVITGTPHPTADDYTGFPIMHASDSVNCVPVSLCYSNGGLVNPYRPKMDDQAALARLYPVTAQNRNMFPGKLISAQATARIHGNVYFKNSNGQPAQGMQGVNVVARWIDPSTGLPSRAYAESSVSGFLFTGNAGNTISGFDDPTGQPFSRFGSTDPALEGFFDLSGLQIPTGSTSAQYQLSVEPIDPELSEDVGPYAPLQVQPSGSYAPTVVTVTLGGDVLQNILMQSSALAKPAYFDPTTYPSPAPLPAGGDWTGSLSAYGDTDYFWFNAKSNRSLSVVVTALDQFGTASQSRTATSRWNVGVVVIRGRFLHPQNAFGIQHLRLRGNAVGRRTSTDNFISIGHFRLPWRRPSDYRYHARVFYGDTVAPARASVAGNTPILIKGLGFLTSSVVSVGALNSPLLAVSADNLLVNAPPMPDGISDVTLNDGATGAGSTMSAALTYGAGPADNIVLVSGANPATPMGGAASNPIRVKVVAPDGVTPVAGASVFLISSPAVAFSVCNGATTCTVLSDQSGQVATGGTVLSNGAATITAKLAPASYVTPKQVQTTILGLSSSLDISLSSANAWIAQGATSALPLSARVLSNGSPLIGRTVNYQIMKGSATLTSGRAITDSTGLSSTTLQITNLAGDLQVSACVAPANAPCQIFNATAVPVSGLQLLPVSGTVQAAPVGTSFHPVTIRVTDTATPPNPVLAASVFFQTVTGRSPNDSPMLWIAGTGITQPTIPVLLAETQATLTSDSNGLVSIQPSSGAIQGPVVILGTASIGTSALDFGLQSLSRPGR